MLGRPTLDVRDGQTTTDLRIRRGDGIQILAYLTANPDGATSDELMAALWPEVRPQYSRGRFHTVNSELRQHLDTAIGAEVIRRIGERYQLDPQHVDVDLWQMNNAVDLAATALDPRRHTDALHEITRLYVGVLAEGHSWLWLAPYRETARRHVMDAYTRLAETESDPRIALGIIEQAIRHDPYNEDLYQRAMRLHATLESAEGVRHTMRTLAERLGQLEVPPSPQTQALAADLLTKLDARNRRRDPEV
jgi:DNA-binding SARP family transcriptional activator